MGLTTRLKVSENRRFLTDEDGRHFFYLGDTAWGLFHDLRREEALDYLRDRAAKGFTVIQAVALNDGIDTANAYGCLPLIDNDPERPDVRPADQYDYWDHVDFIVDQAAALGMFVGFLPTWGDKWHGPMEKHFIDGKLREGVGPKIFTPKNAEIYGRWLGQRYKDKPLIWILGGDRPITTDEHRQIICAMAKGLREGDEGRHLITFHPRGGKSSAEDFHKETWLDFNMVQNAHGILYNKQHDRIRANYSLQPIKPVIDGEPLYEDFPLAFNPVDNGYSTAADVRRPLYWDLFGGTCGHTYGHNSIIHFATDEKKNRFNSIMTWLEALDRPGATQMQHARRLLESRPVLSRIPDDTILIPAKNPAAVPGAGFRRMMATRDIDGSWAMVYASVSRAFSVRMNCISGPQAIAWWFNPRNGTAERIDTFDTKTDRQFIPPEEGELLDWVLVLDDTQRNYPPPGSV